MTYDRPSFYKKNRKKKINYEKTKKEDSNFISTPSSKARGEKSSFSKFNNKSNSFRKRSIPDSLQNLDGWIKRELNEELINRLKNRLSKNENEYLLFEDSETLRKNQKENKISEKNLESKEEKIEIAHEKVKKSVTKPSTALDRSLSKIIAEDEEAIKNGKNSLKSLFADIESK